MKILILGSEGFIGSNLIKHFNKEGFQVYGCDLVDKPSAFFTYYQVEKSLLQWKNIFSQGQFDYCINAAGNGNVNFSLEKPFEDFQSNTLDTIQILEALRRFNPGCRYLHISSAAVYGNPVSLPVREDALCSPVSPYGWHKLMAEHACKEFSSIFDLPVAVVRPFSIYGPGLRKQLFWDVYQKFILNNGHVELWGSGEESRDFIYIDDVVRSFSLILSNAPMNGETYNIASGTEYTVREVVNKLFEYAGKKPLITFNQIAREGNPLNWRADIAAISSLGFSPSVHIDEGIRHLSEWLEGLG